MLAASMCSVLGFYLESMATAIVTLPAVFLAFWGNGLVYGVSAKCFESTKQKNTFVSKDRRQNTEDLTKTAKNNKLIS